MKLKRVVGGKLQMIFVIYFLINLKKKKKVHGEV